MAARAPDGDAHKGFANRVELVIHDVGEDLVLVSIPVAPVPKCQPAGGDDAELTGKPFASAGFGDPAAVDLIENRGRSIASVLRFFRRLFLYVYSVLIPFVAV